MTAQEVIDSLTKAEIPVHLHGGILRYVDVGIRPGGFLCACIAMDADDALKRAADIETSIAIPAITHWFLFDAPQGCAGSREKLEEWIASKRNERLAFQNQKG
jgi:hypothetical protein